MNDLIRPAFYESFHEIVPVKQTKNRPIATDVVGGIARPATPSAKTDPSHAWKKEISWPCSAPARTDS